MHTSLSYGAAGAAKLASAVPGIAHNVGTDGQMTDGHVNADLVREERGCTWPRVEKRPGRALHFYRQR